MLTHLRVHLLLVLLSGIAKLHSNIFLFKRTVVQANKNSKRYQNKILCDSPFLLWYGRGGSRCYLSDIMHLYVLRYILERACKNLYRMQQNKEKKEEAAAPLLNLLLSLIAPNGGMYSRAVGLWTGKMRFATGCKASAVCGAVPLDGGRYCVVHMQ